MLWGLFSDKAQTLLSIAIDDDMSGQKMGGTSEREFIEKLHKEIEESNR